MTPAERQAAFRARRDAKLRNRTEALEQIVLRLSGKHSPLAVDVLAIAERGLRIDRPGIGDGGNDG